MEQKDINHLLKSLKAQEANLLELKQQLEQLSRSIRENRNILNEFEQSVNQRFHPELDFKHGGQEIESSQRIDNEDPFAGVNVLIDENVVVSQDPFAGADVLVDFERPSEIKYSDALRNANRYPSLSYGQERNVSSAENFIEVEFVPGPGEVMDLFHTFDYMDLALGVLIEAYELREDTRIKVVAMDSVGNRTWSSKVMTVSQLRDWIAMGFQGINEESKVEMPTIVIFSFEDPRPAGCGEDEYLGQRTLMPSYAHDTSKCGAISIILLYYREQCRRAEEQLCKLYKMDAKTLQKNTKAIKQKIENSLKELHKQAKELQSKWDHTKESQFEGNEYVELEIKITAQMKEERIIREKIQYVYNLFKYIELWKYINQNRYAQNPDSTVSKKRHELADKLLTACSFNVNQKLTDEEMMQLVKYLAMKDKKNYQISFWKDHGNNYKSSLTEPNDEVDFWFHVHKRTTKSDNHYQAISILTPMQQGKPNEKWCDQCFALKRIGHKCETACSACGSKKNHYKLKWELEEVWDKQQKEKQEVNMEYKMEKYNHNWIICKDCSRACINQECYDMHKKVIESTRKNKAKKYSKCDSIWLCKEIICPFRRDIMIKGCWKQFKTTGSKRCVSEDKWTMLTQEQKDNTHLHRCGEIYCNNCNIWTPGEWPKHECYVKSKKFKKPVKLVLYADFESTLQMNKREELHHRVNVICTTDSNGNDWDVFEDLDLWIDEILKPKWEGATIVFQNGSRYDAQFIAGVCCEKEINFKPQYMDGSGLRELVIQKAKQKNKQIRIMDSMCHLKMSLADLGKIFETTQPKGRYPHKLNTRTNNKFKKPFRELSTSDPTDKLSNNFEEILDLFGYKECPLEKQAELYDFVLDKWNKNEIWDNFKELVDYCKLDVCVSREVCEKYRSWMKHLTLGADGTYCDPFSYLTMPAVAKAIYSARFLVPNTIAALPRWMHEKLMPLCRGGRSDCNYNYWKAEDGQKAYHIDATSMYAEINKYGDYPFQHPIYYSIARLRRINVDANSMESIHNFILNMIGVATIWCNVECPQDLKYGVLHMLRDGKLVFDLIDRENQGYTSMELQEAIKQGYKVTKIQEVIHWPKKMKGITTEFTNAFFKVKTEADGFPEDVKTEEQKDAYIQMFEQMEGIKLCKENIKPNAGLRQTAKMPICSWWGKMAEKLEYENTSIMYPKKEDTQKYMKFRKDGKIKDWHFLSNKVILLVTDPYEQKQNKHIITDKNISLAVFTTAQGRLKLYKEMLNNIDHPLNHRLLYWDTDSCEFFCEKGELPIDFIPKDVHGNRKIGPYLGYWKSENKPKYSFDPKRYIDEFISLGGKNYGYVIVEEDEFGNKTIVEIKFQAKGFDVKRADIAIQLYFQRVKDAILNGTTIDDIEDNKVFKRITNKSHNAPPQREEGFEEMFGIKTITKFKKFRNAWTKGEILPPIRNAKGEIIAIPTRPWNNATKSKYEMIVKLVAKKNNKKFVHNLPLSEDFLDRKQKCDAILNKCNKIAENASNYAKKANDSAYMTCIKIAVINLKDDKDETKSAEKCKKALLDMKYDIEYTRMEEHDQSAIFNRIMGFNSLDSIKAEVHDIFRKHQNRIRNAQKKRALSKSQSDNNKRQKH